MIELWTHLRGGFGRQKADSLAQQVISHGLAVESSEREDYQRAWQIALEWRDQDFSLTDRLAFVAIERTRSYKAWSYDSDFAVIRLGPRRDRAIDLLR